MLDEYVNGNAVTVIKVDSPEVVCKLVKAMGYVASRAKASTSSST